MPLWSPCPIQYTALPSVPHVIYCSFLLPALCSSHDILLFFLSFLPLLSVPSPICHRGCLCYLWQMCSRLNTLVIYLCTFLLLSFLWVSSSFLWAKMILQIITFSKYYLTSVNKGDIIVDKHWDKGRFGIFFSFRRWKGKKRWRISNMTAIKHRQFALQFQAIPISSVLSIVAQHKLFALTDLIKTKTPLCTCANKYKELKY